MWQSANRENLVENLLTFGKGLAKIYYSACLPGAGSKDILWWEITRTCDRFWLQEAMREKKTPTLDLLHIHLYTTFVMFEAKLWFCRFSNALKIWSWVLSFCSLAWMNDCCYLKANRELESPFCNICSKLSNCDVCTLIWSFDRYEEIELAFVSYRLSASMIVFNKDFRCSCHSKSV